MPKKLQRRQFLQLLRQGLLFRKSDAANVAKTWPANHSKVQFIRVGHYKKGWSCTKTSLLRVIYRGRAKPACLVQRHGEGFAKTLCVARSSCKSQWVDRTPIKLALVLRFRILQRCAIADAKELHNATLRRATSNGTKSYNKRASKWIAIDHLCQYVLRAVSPRGFGCLLSPRHTNYPN